MEIIMAKSAGFCFGVTKAIEMVNSLIGEENVYTYGPIIHNTQVVKSLESKKIFSCEDLEKIVLPAKMVIRAHGVSPKVYEMLQEKNVTVFDATCRYVKKIHKLVEEKVAEDYKIIIIGDSEHPEVIGINGWCKEKAIIISEINESTKKMISNILDEKIAVVAQTTLSYEKWKEITDFLKINIKSIQIFDTICSATSKRQKETDEISRKVELMYVIGGQNSSNTEKLFRISKQNCECTFKIESANDLDLEGIEKYNRIGITAGASTPDWVIEEVIKKMSELNKQEDVDFGKFFEEAMVSLSNGDIVTGTVIGFNNNEVYVDLGYKSDGVISASEFTDGSVPIHTVVTKGEKIEVIILRVNDADGNVVVSKKKVEAMRAWKTVDKYFTEKTTIVAKATAIVKGGITAEWSGLKIFIPASQISDRFVKDLNDYLGRDLRIRILEYNQRNRRLVGSQRIVLEEEKVNCESGVWDTIEANKIYTGVVKNITDFGAFVDIGGVDGLIHVSDLAWNKVGHPSEVLKVGETVSVKVKEFNKEKKKISFTYKKEEDDPWVKIMAAFSVGDIIDAKVARLVPFGAFLEVVSGIDGLVHISQICDRRIGKPSDVLKVGDVVKAKIIEINVNSKKINLSIKEADPTIFNEILQEMQSEEVKTLEIQKPEEVASIVETVILETVNETKVKTEVDKTDVDKTETDKTEVDKTETDKTEVDKTETDKTEISEETQSLDNTEPV